MSYTALYRKFRPTEFEEVKGQDHIVTTLKNQIKTDRIGHAYLFTGTRGTGKTTIAKIMAKAVNCENPKEGSPCNECSVCSNINEGTSINVRELDAASNNGVDSIRQIIEEVEYPPTEGRYKVYIIDEVHMLSTGAFNALLKTLEEPPSYVIFILATTEVAKIPITILSRCQRYDFKRITIDTIAKRLRELCDKEGITAEDKAINYIAKVADGSMRDALSLLDQCIAFYLGEDLTFDNVLTCLGAVDTEIFSRLLRYVIDRNVAGTIEIVDEVVQSGKEIGQFVTDFTWYLRNIILIRSSSDMADVIDVSSENLRLLQEEAKLVTDENVMRYIRILSELSNQIKFASSKRVLVEIAMMKLCKPAIEPDVAGVMERLEHLEEEVENGIRINPASISNPTSTGMIENDRTKEQISVKKALPEDIRKVVDNWKNIIDNIQDKSIKMILAQTKLNITEEGGHLAILYDENRASQQETFAVKRIMDEDSNVKGVIEDTIEKVTNLKVVIVVKQTDNSNSGHILDPRKDFKSNVSDKLDFTMTED